MEAGVKAMKIEIEIAVLGIATGALSHLRLLTKAAVR